MSERGAGYLLIPILASKLGNQFLISALPLALYDPAAFAGVDICDFIPAAEVEALCRRRLHEGRFSPAAAFSQATRNAVRLRLPPRCGGNDQ